ARRHAAQKEVGKFLQRFATVDGGAEDPKKIDLIEKVFVELAKRYKNRAGGYTRITKVGNRRGDNAPISIIELVGDDEPKKASKGTAAASASAPAPAEPAPAEEKKVEEAKAKKP